MPQAQNLRLCVDGRMLAPGGTGVSTYARSIVTAQRQIAPLALILHDRSTLGQTSEGRIRRWVRALLPLPAKAHVVEDHTLYAPDLYRLAQVFFDLHGRLLEVRGPGEGGIMHWTYPVPVRLVGWRNVYTIHDAIPLIHPELSPIDPVRHRRLLSRIADRADGLVTVSKAARDEITEALNMEPARIVNCSQPVSPATDGGPPPAGLARGNYLLTLGSVEPRKNIQPLLMAYAASQVRMPLVIAGPASRFHPDLEKAVAATPGAIRLPDVAAADLGRLISGARALVMPSLAEGFGLPVAEAMALGTPVITACRGALAETAGGAALLVEPKDVAAIASALQRITLESDLHRRLSQAGLQNAKRFSPALFADALASLYGDLLAATPR